MRTSTAGRRALLYHTSHSLKRRLGQKRIGVLGGSGEVDGFEVVVVVVD